jgi:hypothetical protein
VNTHHLRVPCAYEPIWAGTQIRPWWRHPPAASSWGRTQAFAGWSGVSEAVGAWPGLSVMWAIRCRLGFRIPDSLDRRLTRIQRSSTTPTMPAVRVVSPVRCVCRVLWHLTHPRRCRSTRSTIQAVQRPPARRKLVLDGLAAIGGADPHIQGGASGRWRKHLTDRQSVHRYDRAGQGLHK